MTHALLCLSLWLAAEPPAALQSAKRAYAAAQAGQWDQAVAALREAARIAPANPQYRTALGGVFERQGRLEEAIAEFAAALKLDPANRPLRDRLETLSLDTGAQLARSGRIRSGLKLAQQTSALYPDSSNAALMLGLFLMRNQQNLASVDAYRRALTLDPASSDASVGLGIAQSKAGLTAEARRTFEAGIERFPQDAVHRQAYGVLLVKLAETGDRDAAQKARALLLEALALDDGLAESQYQLGTLDLAAGDTAAALARFAQASQRGLDDSRLHYAAARALRRAGQEPEAERRLELFRQRKAAEEAAAR